MSARYDVYEVKAPAPEKLRGWYWELKSTFESGGPYRTSREAESACESYLKSIGK